MADEARRLTDLLKIESNCHGSKPQDIFIGHSPVEPAKVEPVKKSSSPMTWLCKCGHSVTFWRNRCDSCGAHAVGFEERDTWGVGFPD